MTGSDLERLPLSAPGNDSLMSSVFIDSAWVLARLPDCLFAQTLRRKGTVQEVNLSVSRLGRINVRRWRVNVQSRTNFTGEDLSQLLMLTATLRLLPSSQST